MDDQMIDIFAQDHSIGRHLKVSLKLTFLTTWYTYTCAYQGGKWYYFFGKLCVRTKWMITRNFRCELWMPRILSSKFGKLLNFCLEHKPIILWPLKIQISIFTAQKMEFSSKYFFSKCEDILKKSLMEERLKKTLIFNFILCAVIYILIFVYVRIF